VRGDAVALCSPWDQIVGKEAAMNANVTEIATDVYRISTFFPDFGIQFNQFLVNDDEPFLFHTGFRKSFAATREAVATVLDPARLRWIGFSHFEADECGALNEWLAAAPRAEAVSSFVGVTVNLGDFADRPARALADDEVLATGRHRLRFLATPHVPHGWDAGLFFDETQRTLFCSDLLFQPGDPPPVAGDEAVRAAREAMAEGQKGPLANDVPYTARTGATLDRLAALEPRLLAAMHGSSYAGDGERALRELGAAMREILGPGGGR
jgi:flavorubredoxin